MVSRLRRWPGSPRPWSWLLAGGALAAVLCLPYLAQVSSVIGPRETAWVQATIREDVRGHVWGALRLLPLRLDDVPVIAAAVSAVIVLLLCPRRALFPLALSAGFLLLGANAAGSWLPMSVLLYPDRIAVLHLYPFAILALEAIAAIRCRWQLPRALVWLATLALVVHSALLQRKLIAAGREKSLVATSDLEALAVLDAQLPPGCWVATNYGDAGQWIPALLGRPITKPQVNVLFMEEVDLQVHPCGAFHGAKRPYGEDAVRTLCPEQGSANCRLDFADGQSEFFSLQDPDFTLHLRAIE